MPWETGDWIWSSVAKLPMALLYSHSYTQTQRDQLLNSAFQAVLTKWLHYFTTVTWPKPPTHPLLSILFLPSENQLSLSLNFSGHSRKYSWAISSFLLPPLCYRHQRLYCLTWEFPVLPDGFLFCFNQWDVFAICSSSQFQPLSFLLFKVMLLYFWVLFISFLFIVWSVCLGLGGIRVTRGTCGGNRTAWGAGSVHFTLWVSSIEFRLSHLTARAFTHWAGLPT